jgi:zinc/manganese transport system permease protein
MSTFIDVILPAFCLCIPLVGMFSYLGLHVVKREIIFVDLALAQIAALGTLIAFMFGIPLHTGGSYWFSVALTAIAAVVFTLCRFRESRVPQEAIIGLAYAIAAAVAILLIDKAPHGAEHVKEILIGSILWVEWRTVVLIALVYAAVGVFHYAFRRNFLLISENPEGAARAGVNVRLWDFLFYLSFGFVITLSVSTAGVLLVFVFLVAPAVMAMMITGRLWYQLLFGWLLGLFTSGIGLIISYLGNLSAGPTVIVGYAVALLIVGAVVANVRAPSRAASLRTTAAICAFFVAAFAALVLIGHTLGQHVHHAHETAAPEARGPSTEAPSEALPGVPTDEASAMAAAPPGQAMDPTELERMFREEADPSLRAEIVQRALRLDPKVGASLALQFLETDPPLFFREQVVEDLKGSTGEDAGFDASRPFADAVNQRAAAQVKAKHGIEHPDP